MTRLSTSRRRRFITGLVFASAVGAVLGATPAPLWVAVVVAALFVSAAVPWTMLR